MSIADQHLMVKMVYVKSFYIMLLYICLRLDLVNTWITDYKMFAQFNISRKNKMSIFRQLLYK